MLNISPSELLVAHQTRLPCLGKMKRTKNEIIPSTLTVNQEKKGDQ